jgi:hypothetical protein
VWRQFTFALALCAVGIASLAIAQQKGTKQEVAPAPNPAPAPPEVDDLWKEMDKAIVKAKQVNGWYEPSATPEQREYYRVPHISLMH